MTELQTEINEAFACIAAIPVTGDQVEIMALAREYLRKAFALAGDTEADNG